MTDDVLVVAGEFFAGIGLARAGLERGGFSVTWSNDISAKKKGLFEGHWGLGDGHEYRLADVSTLGAQDVPERLDLAWASFPCTDLSLAGTRGGLHSGASSTFWSFVKILSRMRENRPKTLAIENVSGFASSRQGRDLSGAIRALNGLGYSVDALQIDARRFVPQSRPRLFLIAEQQPAQDAAEPSSLRPSWLEQVMSDKGLRTHRAHLPPVPELLNEGFTRVSQDIPSDDPMWWGHEKTNAFFRSLSALQSYRLYQLSLKNNLTRRTAFRRMRGGVPRWEVRSDDIAGCLRTSSGGSSRQAVVEVGSGQTRIRWMTPREYAILMGVPDFSLGDARANDVYSGFGDAVCAPVVEWLALNYLMPSCLRQGAVLPSRPVVDLVPVESPLLSSVPAALAAVM